MAEKIENFNHEFITCYTDGSKTEEGKTGYGYVITTDNNKQEISRKESGLPNFCTVFQAETTAITSAAKIRDQLFKTKRTWN